MQQLGLKGLKGVLASVCISIVGLSWLPYDAVILENKKVAIFTYHKGEHTSMKVSKRTLRIDDCEIMDFFVGGNSLVLRCSGLVKPSSYYACGGVTDRGSPHTSRGQRSKIERLGTRLGSDTCLFLRT